jgi:hypothetical protein
MAKAKSKPETLPCLIARETQDQVTEYAKALRKAAPELGSHGLSFDLFWDSGIFRGAIEKLRGEQAATMKDKRSFIKDVLVWMKEIHAVADWRVAGSKDRHDYEVVMPSGKVCAIEAKGCLDGNNTNIFERPANADEFIIWSLCQNPMADPRKNAWSGIHTRLSAEIVHRRMLVDGLVIWDPVCNTLGRPCPKVERNKERVRRIGARIMSPPCIYLFPRTVPDVRNNPAPLPHRLEEVQFLEALHREFFGHSEDLTEVFISVGMMGASVGRKTKLIRGGRVIVEAKMTAIKRART